jgi:hypothetical protein
VIDRVGKLGDESESAEAVERALNCLLREELLVELSASTKFGDAVMALFTLSVQETTKVAHMCFGKAKVMGKRATLSEMLSLFGNQKDLFGNPVSIQLGSHIESALQQKDPVQRIVTLAPEFMALCRRVDRLIFLTSHAGALASAEPASIIEPTEDPVVLRMLFGQIVFHHTPADVKYVGPCPFSGKKLDFSKWEAAK